LWFAVIPARKFWSKLAGIPAGASAADIATRTFQIPVKSPPSSSNCSRPDMLS